MRRRIWAFLRQGDIMFSAQLALPNMIKEGDFDTESPRNIFEDEFGPDKELPPPRPITEPTPVSYMIAKSTLSYIYGDIVNISNAVVGHAVTYEEVMRKDQELRDVHDNMAPHLKIRRLEDCMLDPASLLMQRFYLDCLYQKSLIVLHRKYMARARNNSRYAHSRRACVDASLMLLKHQETFHAESLPGGRLRAMKWYISSLTKHDFLLGALVICLDLNYDSVCTKYDRNFWSVEQRSDMLRALDVSRNIWKLDADSSMEAYKACKILNVMLEKLSRPPPTEPQSNNDAFEAFDNLQPEHSAAMTLGMLSNGGLTPNTAQMFNNPPNMPLGQGGMKYNFDMSMGDPSNLTPNFMMDANPVGSLNGPASPFSQSFSNMAGGSMIDLPANIDWVRTTKQHSTAYML